MPQDISFKRINKLAFPALIAGVAEPLLSTTDLAIVGNIPINATESIAAIGIVGAFLSMLIWVFGQTRSGISSIISQYVGANKLAEVKNLPAQATGIVVLTSLVILGITYPFAKEIFEFYNASGTILNYAIEYYKIRVFGFPFTLFVIAVFGTFRGLQNTLYPMLIAIVGTVVNIVLDIIFVYGIEGYIPAMNITGAAYASVIAQIIMALVSAYLLLTKTEISLKFTLPFNKEIPRFINMILNLFVRTIALNTALYFATSYATSYGKQYIAAYTIGLNIWLMGAFMIDGYSSAGNILSGKLLGAKAHASLLKLGNNLLLYGFVFGVFLAIIGFVFYDFIGTIFTKEQAVLDAFYSTFWIILIMQPICAIAFIYDGMFKGMGEMKYLRNVLLLATALVFIPVLFFFDSLDYKLYAIWIAFYAWIVARAIPLIFKFRKRFL
ncbi:MATE family efflux transporter [Tenacibaculum piscium]|uniref:Multidrug-efflux transporter n=1 Tax=Tenacibaculum piscium TaxID=1458515 RepID=A0A2H1YK61_9FLAO|nr:MATE family efflux transporter [Tenacibaculum piscium]MBE7629413.1 MATE family efflux transporter [Tenacibaculum piscium]MBE7671284.1 MATE family efflux transporter [Tenacibaculum piscium]MCG8183134.1 MATE family efflux transporter [Tenacibaculum piscium]MCG8204682.1 MATE family efflux transporter [Tenacibaculum piscium]SOS75791.1 MATE family efflux transporter [Tenacibaculum piscium]